MTQARELVDPPQVELVAQARARREDHDRTGSHQEQDHYGDQIGQPAPRFGHNVIYGKHLSLNTCPNGPNVHILYLIFRHIATLICKKRVPAPAIVRFHHRDAENIEQKT